MSKLDEVVTKSYLDEKINSVMEKLDWLIGKYKSHDEEHILLNGKVSDHSDRLEVIEEKVRITV